METFLLILVNTWFYLQLMFSARRLKFQPAPLLLRVVKQCRRVWQQELLTQIQWRIKKKRSPSYKISTTVKFVLVVLTSIFPQPQFCSHHFEKHENGFFFVFGGFFLPVVVNILSYCHRTTRKAWAPVLFLLAIIPYKITSPFSVTL